MVLTFNLVGDTLTRWCHSAVLECEFAEVEDVGVALPDCARRTPASIISSPGSPWGQDCYIVIAEPRASSTRLSYGGVIRQWPELSDFVARFCTLRESKNLWPCENRVLFSHFRRFFDLCNVQKSVTQIIYLLPLPKETAISFDKMFHKC